MVGHRDREGLSQEKCGGPWQGWGLEHHVDGIIYYHPKGTVLELTATET